MKPGDSKLNPYAEAYVPLSKRVSQPEINDVEAFQQGDSEASPSESASEAAEVQMMFERFYQDMSSLRNAFQGFSDESLAGVYWSLGGDLEATLNAMEQLAASPPRDGSSENLPDSLDIGDVSEFSSLKLKNVPVADEGSSHSASSFKGVS